MNKTTKQIASQIFKIDKKFYNDNFFTQSDIVQIMLNKSKNKIYVDNVNSPTAYIIIFKMPSGAIYITSLAGPKKARRELLLAAIARSKNKRIYTHGKEKWGMDLLRECGFKKRGRGNPSDEEVEFGDDITKLTLYEMYT